MTHVAVFTDHDLTGVSDVDAAWTAVLRHASDRVAPRIYTATDVRRADPSCYAVRSVALRLPWSRQVRLCWPNLAKLERQVTETRAEVIHIATPGPVGLAGRVIAQRLRLPTTGSCHVDVGVPGDASSGSRALGRVSEAFMRWLYRPCRPLLVPSHAALDALLLAGYRADRLLAWPGGVDTGLFSPERRSEWLRGLWGISDRRPALAYVGRLSRGHELHLLPLIQRELAALGIAHRLVIVGDGPMGAELRERCPDAAFLGERSSLGTAIAMASADVLLFPSVTTAPGTVVLEAQACGLPVVVSDRGGSQEQMLPGRTGLVARAGVAVEFADAVRRIVRDGEALRGMRRETRAFAMTRQWNDAIRPLVLAWHRAARASATPGAIRTLRRGAGVEPTSPRSAL
jgi:glycosyltransferase involved in cell wall biosynthesis